MSNNKSFCSSKIILMNPYTFAFLTFGLLICIHVLLHLKNLIFNKQKRLPPGPFALPIIGNLLSIGHKPHESLAKLAEIYGPFMTVQLGFNTTIVATSPEISKEILQKHDQSFLGRPIPHAVTAERNYELSMAWLPGGPKWRNLRKICNTHVFTMQRLDELQGLRHQMVYNMIQQVAEAGHSGRAINIGRLVFGTTLSLLSNTMFSVDILDLNSDSIEELKILIGKIMELAGKPNMADYFPFLKPFDPQGIKRKIKVSYDRLHTLMDGMIDQRLTRKDQNGMGRCNDFLYTLLDLRKNNGPDEFNREDINILLADLFIGGTDTTTTTMEWAMTELLRNPNVMSKAKQELIKTIGRTKTVQENDVLQLPYLQSILKETMRLHTTAPLLLPHRAETLVEICGYTIPKHTQVFINAWAIARDPVFWDDPIKFNPERFMKSEIDFRGTNFWYIPFGSGRRICPGLNLGVRMMSLMLATLIHHFDWELPNGVAPEDIDVNDKFGVTLQKATPLMAIPVVVDFDK